MLGACDWVHRVDAIVERLGLAEEHSGLVHRHAERVPHEDPVPASLSTSRAEDEAKKLTGWRRARSTTSSS